MSIEANDLRINNWVKHPHVNERFFQILEINKGTNGYVFSIGRDKIEDVLIDNETEPIPLTPELLEKCGFTQLENKFTFDKGKLSIHLPSHSYKKGRTYFNSWCIVEHSIQYLHQLQNIFHSLTGDELVIDNL